MPKLYMSPSPKSYRRNHRKNKPSSGIQEVVESVASRLPERGWEIVDDPKAADVVAGHACAIDKVDVLHCHGLYPTGSVNNSSPWQWSVNAKVIELARQAKVTTVPSPWVAELFQRDMGFTPEILRHGVDLNKIGSPVPVDRRSNSILWNKNRPSAVCSPEPVKKLAERLPRTHFVTTFGEKRSNIEITGTLPHDDMMNVLKHAGVYLSTTRETFGIGILEALALGVPVVAWNWGHARELVTSGETGYIVEPGDYSETVNGIQYCLEHLEDLSPKCIETAKRYSWDPVADMYDRVYRSVLEPHTGPLTSIVITAYNYEDYVAEAIDSVKSQTRDDWECIVVDDGSTDDTFQAAIDAVGNDGRFTIVTQNNLGVDGARNRGAMLARGKYLAFLDADDRLKPKFLELLLPHLENRPDLALAFGRLEIFKTGSEPRMGQWPDGFNFTRQLKKSNQVPACNLMRREIFLRTGGLRSKFIPTEDAALWTRMGMLGYKMDMVTRAPTYEYRIHDKAATAKVRSRDEAEPDWHWPRAPGFASLNRPSEGRPSHPIYNYDKPLVSFVIPVGDGHEDIVLKAIDSVVAQTRPEWECIVVDDTSEGDLKDHGIIPYKERFPFVRFLATKGQNVSHARNYGAERARGQFLCFLDADDILHREYLARTLKQAGNCMVYTDFLELPKRKPHETQEFSMRKIRSRALFPITFLHPKRAWQEVGGFDEDLAGWEDWDYALNLALHGYCGVRVSKPLVGYRYGTGHRREDSLKQKEILLEQIHKKWDGVSATQCRPVDPNPDQKTLGSENQRERTTRANYPGLVEVEFLPDQRGARLYRTPRGTSYRFGSGQHRRKLVNQKDLEYFRQRQAEFEVHPSEARSTERLDLPGVSDKLLEHLRSNGWTLESLQKAFVSDLPDIPTETAKRIIERTQEVAEVDESKDNNVWDIDREKQAPTTKPKAKRRPMSKRRRGGG